MSVVLFLVILAVLVFVHELGHFLIAKLSRIRVDEFGIGFPPRIFSFKKGETRYSINLIPFGGFVKIFGENPDEESIKGKDSARSFVNKPKYIQVAVLAAGVVFNIIFAWILISSGFMAGFPTSVSERHADQVQNAELVVTAVSPQSPADKAGLKQGDEILFVSSGNDALQGDQLSVENVQKFIASHGNAEMSILAERGDEKKTIMVTPQSGIVEGRPAIGIAMDMVGVLKLPIHKALWEGALLTGELVKATAVGIAQFIGQAFTGQADLSQVSGPVGIAGMVGSARELGIIYLLSFTAFISINLAVLNLIPFPALDGGRILFVAIEAIKRSPIKPTIANSINAIGFALLIILMLVVTYKDIARLFMN